MSQQIKRIALIATTGLLAVLIQGCAHGNLEKEVDQKVAAEAPIPNSTALATQAEIILQAAPGLTDAQRSKLEALKNDTRTQMREATEQSLKLRSLLYQDLVATNFNRSEVNLLKSKIQTVEKNKIVLLLDAVEKANTILGHDVVENEQRLDDFYFEMLRSPANKY